MILTQKQLAKHLQVGESTVARWAKDNAIPTLRVGKTVRYDLQDVLRAMGKEPEKEDSQEQ